MQVKVIVELSGKDHSDRVRKVSKLRFSSPRSFCKAPSSTADVFLCILAPFFCRWSLLGTGKGLPCAVGKQCGIFNSALTNQSCGYSFTFKYSTTFDYKTSQPLLITLKRYRSSINFSSLSKVVISKVVYSTRRTYGTSSD